MYIFRHMSTTLGIHWAITTYGTWLHGNSHGSWHEGRLVDSDPYLEAAAKAAMNHQAVVLNQHERTLVAKAIGNAVLENQYRILAATIQGAHLHLVFAPLRTDVKRVIAQLKYRSAVAVLADRRVGLSPDPFDWINPLYRPSNLPRERLQEGLPSW